LLEDKKLDAGATAVEELEVYFRRYRSGKCGGRMIRRIGEKFGVKQSAGTGSLSLPLPSNPGRSELELKLMAGQAICKRQEKMAAIGCSYCLRVG
jgi:hypothetical protein